MAKHVILGGGTGFIGKYIQGALLGRGAKVTIVSRTSGLDRITWDTVDRLGLPNDATSVINVAGENILNPIHSWNEKFKKAVWGSRVETTKILTRAVLASNVNSYITMSGVAYYPPDEQKEYTEDSVCETYDYLSELTHAWEEAAKLPGHKKCRQVTIRSGVVLGKHGGIVSQIFLPYFLGLGGPLGKGNQFFPWIHVRDLTRIFLAAVHQSEIRGVLNGVAPQVITNAQFSKSFAKALSRPSYFRTPEFVLKLIFSERAKIMLEGQKVIPKRVLDYKFIYEYPDIDKACNGIIEDINNRYV